jgi:hypothetical protein
MSILARRLGWTGWLLVLVYIGALTAISHYIAHWFIFSQELSFYEVFFTVSISTLVLYVLDQAYGALRNKSSSSKWWSRSLKILSIIFGVMGFVYLSIGLLLSFSVYDYSSDPEFNALSFESQKFIIQNSYLFDLFLQYQAVLRL